MNYAKKSLIFVLVAALSTSCTINDETIAFAGEDFKLTQQSDNQQGKYGEVGNNEISTDELVSTVNEQAGLIENTLEEKSTEDVGMSEPSDVEITTEYVSRQNETTTQQHTTKPNNTEHNWWDDPYTGSHSGGKDNTDSSSPGGGKDNLPGSVVERPTNSEEAITPHEVEMSGSLPNGSGENTSNSIIAKRKVSYYIISYSRKYAMKKGGKVHAQYRMLCRKKYVTRIYMVITIEKKKNKKWYKYKKISKNCRDYTALLDSTVFLKHKGRYRMKAVARLYSGTKYLGSKTIKTNGKNRKQ